MPVEVITAVMHQFFQRISLCALCMTSAYVQSVTVISLHLALTALFKGTNCTWQELRCGRLVACFITLSNSHMSPLQAKDGGQHSRLAAKQSDNRADLQVVFPLLLRMTFILLSDR